MKAKKDQYYKDLKHPNWTSKKEEILERDNHMCQLCGSIDNLHVHHLYYYKDFYVAPYDYPNDALLTVCKHCHYEVHLNDEVLYI